METKFGSKIRVTDLFAGAGGLTEGLLSLSNQFVANQAVEMDMDAAATYKANFPEADVANSNILDWINSGQLVETDLIVGGPPCQGFSTLGKQDQNDEKNLLWVQFADAVFQANPSYFVLENVPQFSTSTQRAVFESELAEGKLSNYTASIFTVNTADFGAPQLRKRMIILGSRKDVATLKLPVPTHIPENYATVRDALSGVPLEVSGIDLPDKKMVIEGKTRPGVFRTDELHLGRNYSKLSMDRFVEIPPGGNRFDLPDELKAPCWIKHTTGSGDVMGRLRWDQPSVTIRTEFNKPEKGRYLHPTEHRAITHFEAARIMGFRDDYKWVGSKTSIAKQIGNAVPIQLGNAIGRQILNLMAAVPLAS
ncbi:DNA cytosine methyltransferase [Corynebacterium callunae]|uniref:DNA cytosine methyltransferase n=1 Tax=Corynebacterium callunae TaxID=1721 RepID=UPI003981DA8A